MAAYYPFVVAASSDKYHLRKGDTSEALCNQSLVEHEIKPDPPAGRTMCAHCRFRIKAMIHREITRDR